VQAQQTQRQRAQAQQGGDQGLVHGSQAK